MINTIISIFLVIVGSFALVVYLLQEHNKKKNAASIIVLQIDEIQSRLQEINSYISNGRINFVAFYESLPLLEENYWNLYKHYFVGKMNADGYATLNKFYEYATEIQAQVTLLKDIQRESFNISQRTISEIEAQFIVFDINKINDSLNTNKLSTALINTIPGNVNIDDRATITEALKQFTDPNISFDFDRFWKMYSKHQQIIETLFSRTDIKVLTSYSPIQINDTLEKVLKKYSLLEVKGSNGYELLRKIAKRN